MKISPEVLLNNLQSPMKSGVKVDGSHQRFIGISQDGQFLLAPIQTFAFPEEKMAFQPELRGKMCERGLPDEMGPSYRKSSFLSFWEFPKQEVTDREVEHGIAKKFQDFIGHLLRRIILMKERFMGKGLIEPADLIKLMPKPSLQLL
jgi:hypothetical protein